MTSMDAERCIGCAEEEFKSNRIEEAFKLANMAKQLNPDCDSIDNIVAVYAVHAAASKKTINGEVDWYAVLGIADRVRVDTEEIKKSYRRLALMVHPDKNSSAAAESAFKLVGEAWSVLSQASTREPYDLRTRTRSSSSSTPQAQTSSAMPCDGGFGVYYPGIPIIPTAFAFSLPLSPLPFALFSFNFKTFSRDFVMDGVGAEAVQNHPLKTHKYFLAAQICFRFLATLTTLAAAWIIFTSSQSIVMYGIKFDARYSYSSAFKFFAFANLIASVFSVLSLFLAFILGRKGSDATNYFYMFLHDLVMMTLVMAGCAAATAIGFVGRYGNSHTGWIAFCDHFVKFCDRVTISVILSYFSFLFYLFLTISSASKSRKTQV
ncbi:hypothetical protein F0562_023224 [Nyssa sinensis]|uniref:CASP-like protein n=1 Tax=Nyssa sinensis TaxID=561372 RepID=A0A5J5BK43_9ASTE|nr:hypothetical protein F0562_023224 [Nyssa sinensis]